jgi:hypothetical protein
LWEGRGFPSAQGSGVRNLVIQQQDDSVDIFVDIANLILTYQYNSSVFLFDEQYKNISCSKIG